jgi:hypothetical protein
MHPFKKNIAKGIEAKILFASKCKKIAAKSPTLAPYESFIITGIGAKDLPKLLLLFYF